MFRWGTKLKNTKEKMMKNITGEALTRVTLIILTLLCITGVGLDKP
jgi:hypothetical protein